MSSLWSKLHSKSRTLSLPGRKHVAVRECPVSPMGPPCPPSNLKDFEKPFKSPVRRLSNIYEALTKRSIVLRAQIFVASSVLIVNLIWTLWATGTYGTQDGVGTIFLGDCNYSQRLNTYFHVAINVLSTVLLASSNYSMQLVSAPTREEIDRAHQARKWMDIGIPSARNLLGREWKYRVTWVGLALSSAVLHLFWNSAIFTSVPAFQYGLAIATNDFAERNDSWGTIKGYDLDSMRLASSSFERLENADCINRYIGALNGGKDLVVVTSMKAADISNRTLVTMDVAGTSQWFDIGYWICGSRGIYPKLGGGGCTADAIHPFISSWSVATDMQSGNATHYALGSVPVEYCLSAGVNAINERCGLHFSSTIMWIVCFMNFLKCGFVLFVSCYSGCKDSLVTLGDVVASFLESPDKTTKGMCMATKKSFPRKGNWGPGAVVFNSRKTRWISATTKGQFGSTVALHLITLIIVGALLGAAIATRIRDHRPSSLSSLFAQGLGTTDSQALLSGYGAPQNLFGTVVLANAFQLFFSAIYFLYNNAISCMLVAAEWSRYALRRKPLRVSTPRGPQRSSYFLSVPYRYGIPLMTASGVLQWLVSQSVFLVRTLIFPPTSPTTVPTAAAVSQSNRVGYSPIAIIFSFSLTALLVIALLFIALRNAYPEGEDSMPLAGTCSAAISAACHGPLAFVGNGGQREGEVEGKWARTQHHLLPVQWGVLASEEGRVGHCGFSSGEIGKVKEGKVYA